MQLSGIIESADYNVKSARICNHLNRLGEFPFAPKSHGKTLKATAIRNGKRGKVATAPARGGEHG